LNEREKKVSSVHVIFDDDEQHLSIKRRNKINREEFGH
jgi:hypothetical protein